MKRRDFLKFAGGAAAGCALAGGLVRGIKKLAQGDGSRPAPGVERWVNTVCQSCPGGCGIRVRLINGRAVKIDGNPHHPVNRGKLCPKGQAGLQILYNPDRIKNPLLRDGPKGSNKWKNITWPDAIQHVTMKLKDLRDGGLSHTLGFLTGNNRGLLPNLCQRFMHAYGSNNFFVEPKAEDAVNTAVYLTQGVKGSLAYDIENTDYILSFGAGLLEGWGSPVRNMRAYGYLRQGRPGHRVKIVQLEPRLSMTAAKADEWVPLQPDAFATFALGLAYVIISEKHYDQEFIESNTSGFNEWRSYILRNYSLSDVAAKTNVPAETILRIAREFAQNRPSLSIGDSGGGNFSGSVQENLAIYSLNVLVGNIGRKGGVFLQRDLPLPAWHEAELDEIAKIGLTFPAKGRSVSRPYLNPFLNLPEEVLSKRDYPLQALFTYQSNPVYDWPDRQVELAFQKIPFIVSFSSFLDETALQSDIILPEHTYLERWQDAPVPPGIPYMLCGLSQPVVEPLYDTRSAGDVLIEISRALGGTVSSAFSWKDFKEVVSENLKGLFTAQRGYVIGGTAFEETWHNLLEKVGWWAPSYNSAEELWEQMGQRGGWWDPNYPLEDWERLFKTASGKFEFFPQAVKLYIKEGQSIYEREVQGLTEKKGEFYLLPFGLLVLSGRDGANQPFMQEVLGPNVQMEWDSWIEMNPEVARDMGLKDGDWVYVISGDKKEKCRVKLYPGIRPDCVGIPLGLGRKALGRWAKDRGINPLEFVGIRRDPVFESPDFLTKVRIEKA